MSATQSLAFTAEPAPTADHAESAPAWLVGKEAMLPAGRVMWASAALIATALAVLLVG